MTIPRKEIFFCDLCEKEYRCETVFTRDLHIRRLHSAKVIGDAVKEYTRIVFEDMR